MARHDECFFTAKDYSRLFYEADTPEHPKAHIGIVHGYADHCGRYGKTIDALVAQGFAVHAFDYRGHGQADGRRGYCDRWEDYVDDLEAFHRRMVASAAGQKTFLLGHSHGGLMVLAYLERRPANLAGAVLSSPYLRLAMKAPRLQVLGARAANRLVPWLPIRNPLTSKELTKNLEEQRLCDRDPLYNRTVTPRWFLECNVAQERILRSGSNVRLPVLAFCGSGDTVAAPDATRAFFQTIASQEKRFKEYPGMLHECLNEIGREEVWQDISRWISERV